MLGEQGPRYTETVAEKAAAFQEAFFPRPPPVDLSDLEDYIYPEDQVEFPEVTRNEIAQAEVCPWKQGPRQ